MDGLMDVGVRVPCVVTRKELKALALAVFEIWTDVHRTEIIDICREFYLMPMLPRKGRI